MNGPFSSLKVGQKVRLPRALGCWAPAGEVVTAAKVSGEGNGIVVVIISGAVVAGRATRQEATGRWGRLHPGPPALAGSLDCGRSCPDRPRTARHVGFRAAFGSGVEVGPRSFQTALGLRERPVGSAGRG